MLFPLGHPGLVMTNGLRCGLLMLWWIKQQEAFELVCFHLNSHEIVECFIYEDQCSKRNVLEEDNGISNKLCSPEELSDLKWNLRLNACRFSDAKSSIWKVMREETGSGLFHAPSKVTEASKCGNTSLLCHRIPIWHQARLRQGLIIVLVDFGARPFCQ